MVAFGCARFLHNSRVLVREIPRIRPFTASRTLSYVSQEYGRSTRDPAPLYFDPDVQSLLKKLTRIDLARVYCRRKLGGKKLTLPTYKFVTNEELQDLVDDANRRVNEVLQMPPVLRLRAPTDRVLSHDPALQGLETAKHVFTDVTFGASDRRRVIVVRDADGTLREADWDERHRMNEMFFPRGGRKIKLPRMFQDEYLVTLLTRKDYEFVLDRACVQLEPDEPLYQKVTSITYQHLNDNNGFDSLRSTRHFGPLAFFLTWFKAVDNLILELIETGDISEVNHLLQVYGKVHEKCYETTLPEGLEGLSQYIENDSQKKASLELALQAYKDVEKQRKEREEGIQVAHGNV